MMTIKVIIDNRKIVKDLILLTIILKEIKIVGSTRKISPWHLIVIKTKMIKVNNESFKIVLNLTFHLMIGVMLILVIRCRNYQKKRKVIMEVKTFINQIIMNRMTGKKMRKIKELINGMSNRIKIMIITREMLDIIIGEINVIKTTEIMTIGREIILKIGIKDIVVIRMVNIIIGKIALINKEQDKKVGKIDHLYRETMKIIGIVEIVKIEGKVEVKAHSINQDLIGLKNVKTKIIENNKINTITSILTTTSFKGIKTLISRKKVFKTIIIIMKTSTTAVVKNIIINKNGTTMNKIKII